MGGVTVDEGEWVNRHTIIRVGRAYPRYPGTRPDRHLNRLVQHLIANSCVHAPSVGVLHAWEAVLLPITLAVLNDYPIVVAGLRAVLDPYAHRVRVVELDVRTSVVSRVDVVLQDTFASVVGPVPMPVGATGPGSPKRVLYTWNRDSDLIRAALHDGIDGYVLKSVSPDELVDAIERIFHGERLFWEGEGHATAPALGRWPGDEHGLSGRESEVLALICQGLSNTDISQQAYIGINTVKTYVRSAYRKVGVTTRAQAVIWGLAHGFAAIEHRTIL